MVSGTGVRQLSCDLAVASCLKGPGVDLLVILGVDVPRVADRLWVRLGLLREHRDLLFREAELVERWDVEILSQLIDVLDREFRGLPDRLVGCVEGEGLRDAGNAPRRR